MSDAATPLGPYTPIESEFSPPLLPPPPPKCGQCTNVATFSCPGCSPILLFDQTIPVWYCSAECQKADLERHSNHCKHVQAVKRLYRVGSILVKHFMVFRAAAFDRTIDRISGLVNGKLYLYDDRPLYDAVIDTFTTFPAPLFNQFNYSANLIQAALAYKADLEAVAWMCELVEYLLIGISKDIHEVDVKPKNHIFETIVVGDLESDQRRSNLYHRIIVVTLEHGDKYALDLAGAQFGHFPPVTPWDEYHTKRTQIVSVTHHPLGRTRAELRLRMGTSGPLAARSLAYNLAHVELKLAVLDWEQESKLTVEKLLSFDDAAFDKERPRFSLCLSRRVAHRIKMVTAEMTVEVDEDS